MAAFWVPRVLEPGFGLKTPLFFTHRSDALEAPESTEEFTILLPAIDEDPREEEIFEVLDRGVDGIMTDRPARLRQILDVWKGRH